MICAGSSAAAPVQNPEAGASLAGQSLLQMLQGGSPSLAGSAPSHEPSAEHVNANHKVSHWLSSFRKGMVGDRRKGHIEPGSKIRNTSQGKDPVYIQTQRVYGVSTVVPQFFSEVNRQSAIDSCRWTFLKENCCL